MKQSQYFTFSWNSALTLVALSILCAFCNSVYFDQELSGPIVLFSVFLVYLILKFVLNRRLVSEFGQFLQPANSSYKTSGKEAFLDVEQLKTDDLILPVKNQIIWHDTVVASGSGVFDVLVEKIHYSRIFIANGDSVPGGSILRAGTPELKIRGITTSSMAAEFVSYFQLNKYTNYLIPACLSLFVSTLALSLILSELTVSAFLSFFTSSLSAFIFVDLLIFLISYKAWLKYRLVGQGIFVKDLPKLTRFKSFKLENSEESVLDSGDLILYSGQADRKKIALILFYLTSYRQSSELEVIRAKLQREIERFYESPLTEVREEQGGLLAKLEDSIVLFGSEEFLLDRTIILDTTEVIGRKADSKAFYLVIDKLVVAGIEIKLRETNLIENSFKQVLAKHNIDYLGRKDSNLQSYKSFGGGLNVEPQPVKQRLIPEQVLAKVSSNLDDLFNSDSNCRLVYNNPNHKNMGTPFAYAKVLRLIKLLIVGLFILILILTTLTSNIILAYVSLTGGALLFILLLLGNERLFPEVD